MALRMKIAPPFEFNNVEGEQPQTHEVAFEREVLDAQVAIQAFTFNFAGAGQEKLDVVKVEARQAGRTGNIVTVRTTVNYVGKPESEYTAKVTVLVIADMK
jgi:hypothetical protein